MSVHQEQIAIIGVACLFPGASTPAEFWDNLVQGKNTTSGTAAEHFGTDPAIFYDPQRRHHDTTYFLRGGYISGFTAYGLPASLDNSFQWALYVAREALADSGYLTHTDVLHQTGLFLGNLSFPTRSSQQLISALYDAPLQEAISALLNTQIHFPNRSAGEIDLRNALISGQPASLVAGMLGLGGAHFALDAACASSLYAVGLACEYLSAGKADLMLAGAVSAADPLFINMGFTHFGAYPSQGESRPLDSTSEGLVSGEGAGMFVLKRYSDALRDGDKIYAVVRGVGLANDGRGKHPLTPNPRGQVLAFQRAYADADLNPAEVQYVECHASGTPLGDKTEINSLDDFFGGRGRAPLLGAVKANLGHLLTTAGMASMLKVVLSMQHSMIPATVGIRAPLNSQNHTFGANQIVARNTPWTSEPKIAGVNAFGFGGVNAHVVLSSAADAQPSRQTPPPAPARLAIVGMDAHFGEVEGLAAFAQMLYDGTQHFKPLPAKRWKGMYDGSDAAHSDAPLGAYIESFEIDFLRFKFPPKEDEQPIAQQLLLLKVADKALQDAGMHEGGNVAVIVALGTELSLHQFRGRLNLSWQLREGLANAGLTLPPHQLDALQDIAKDALNPPAQVNQYTSAIGNIISSRVSAHWNFSGPAFTLSSEENSTFKALEVAQLLLQDDALDAVVVGAVDLAGGLENIMVRREMHPSNSGTPTLSFDQHANGWTVGEGAGAVVLKRADRVRHNERMYAVIDAVAFVQVSADSTGAAASALTEAANSAMQMAGVQPSDITYLEAHASGIAGEDQAEVTAINALYPTVTAAANTVALGSIKANIGHTFNAAGMASLIKTALCLYHRMLPAIPHWTAPKLREGWSAAFYVPHDSRTWLTTAPRRAGINGLGADGTAAHVILCEGGHDTGMTYWQHKPLKLFLIDADHKPGLIGRLGQLETALNDGTALSVLATRAFNVFRSRPFVLALVAKDREGLRKEIEAAKKTLPALIDSGGDWQTPAGSYFTANPVGHKGGVAFVYPGAFNSYPGLGQDWMRLFPAALDHLASLTANPAHTVADTALYQRSLTAPTRAEVRAFRAALADDQIAMMESGLSFAVLYTQVMRDVFRIKPSAAFGYSLGEGSMFWGMDVWGDADTATRRFHESEVFKTRLFGRKQAVREMWGLPDHVPDDFWNSYVITAPASTVIAALENESHVYLTHINTPNEVVIAGEPSACERVIAKIGANFLKAPFEVVIHNETMLSEFNALYELHRNPVNPLYAQGADIAFYSASDYLPIAINTETIARNVARVTCKTVDFPRLVNRVYGDGARVFIELGPGSTCARWVSDTLGEREHISVSIDNLRSDDHTALVKMLARLASHRVPMDLSPLYAPLPEETGERRAMLKTITLGGERIQDVILSEANRRRFMGAAQPGTAQPAIIAAVPPTPLPLPTGSPVIQNQMEIVQATVSAGAMNTRLVGLRDIAASIQAQMTAPHSPQPLTAVPVPVPVQPVQPQPVRLTPPTAVNRFAPSPARFTHHQIDQFARFRIADCFGEEYAIYDHRRAPRIPNTDLLFVSRAIEVNATRLITKPGSSMVTEYDVPADMWFYTENSYPFTPYSVLMEMALQPCGFLSAYMGPTFAFPETDFYFRNLDGYGTLHREVDLRGRTLINRVELLSSTSLQGMIIQKYSFDMQLDGESFYTGESSFGYFTLQAFENQTGLDRGKPPVRWHEANPTFPVKTLPGSRVKKPREDSYLVLPAPRLAFVNEAQVALNGGVKGLGYVWATSKVHPSDWFFACHFHQDPVMPGSLGLETITQAMQLYAVQANLGADFQQPRFANAEAHKMIWKYRGQVLSDSHEINVEVNITGIERRGDRLVMTADASLWKGQLRIYEFKQVAIAITEG